MDFKTISEIFSHFQTQELLISHQVVSSGHIHDTYKLKCRNSLHYILQRFNHRVFQNPHLVMNNIENVLDHLEKSPLGLPRKLHCIPTATQKLLFKDLEGNFWRAFNYIEDSYSLDQVRVLTDAYEGARAFGIFASQLKDMKTSSLKETIPDFHHVGKRWLQLIKAIDENRMTRVSEIKPLVQLALSKEVKASFLNKLINGSTLPLRVAHNDTKISNVLFDQKTDKALCIIDLDTVMPGYLMYDFGDIARTFCNTASEDEAPEKVNFNMGYFEAICKGYFEGMTELLTVEEKQSLVHGPWLMTFIMGIRFLTDYLSGDVYYKIAYKLQNRNRSLNQFALLQQIENNQDQIDAMILNAGQ